MFATITEPEAATGATRAQETVAAVLVAEAGGETVAGLKGVLEVVNNRSRNDPARWAAVVLEAGQFACLNHTTLAELIKKSKEHPRWDLAVRLVKSFRNEDRVKGATYFHAPMDPLPLWARGQKPVARIGRHTFYKL